MEGELLSLILGCREMLCALHARCEDNEFDRLSQTGSVLTFTPPHWVSYI